MMNLDELKELQESHFDSAKRILLEGRHLNPWAFVVGRRSGFAQWKPPEGVKLLGFDEKGRRVKLAAGKHDSDGELMIDMAPTWSTLLSYIRTLNSDHPEFERLMQLSYAVAERMEVGPEERDRAMCRAFMQHSKCEEKDVTAAMVRHVARTVGAVAVIHVTEAWMLKDVSEDERSKGPKSLGDDARSIEALIAVLNTRTTTRMMMAPIYRFAPKPGKARDSGKVEGFGEVQFTATGHEGEKLTGRMVDFLDPLDA